MRIRRLLGQEETSALPRAMFILLLVMLVAAGGSWIGTAQAEFGSGRTMMGGRMQALPEGYRKWVSGDVRWIITPKERAAYLRLKTNDERSEFIRQFWEQHNPPSAAPNAFREEHYRRIAYANEHFAAAVPGWKTARGRVYIVYGPPDSIDSHPSGMNGSPDPVEVWHYREIRQYGPPARRRERTKHRRLSRKMLL